MSSGGVMGVRRRGFLGLRDTTPTPLPSLQDTEGHQFDIENFEFVKTVGTGTFGRVCLVREKTPTVPSSPSSPSSPFYAMKILAMSDVIKLKQVEHVKNEKTILNLISHPFIIKMEWSGRDERFLYMLFEYVCGGELFSYLRSSGKFAVPTATFYACEIVSALEYLHGLGIAYRDLKPENLLLDRSGHLKITDFGFAKKLNDRTWTLCGTPEYLAPEIIQSKGHNRAVDWWALGILIYEMLCGFPPFVDANPFGIYEKILSGRVDFPRHLDNAARDIVKKLLSHDRTKRLGNMKNGAEDVKRHRFFKTLNWDDVYHKRITPPIVPQVSFDGDTRNFDAYPENDWQSAPPISQADLHIFSDF